MINFGDLNRIFPFSRDHGFSRGKPIDRRYMEDFLKKNEVAIKGRVLEFLSPEYTERFGGARVTHSDVWCIRSDEGWKTTIVGDLQKDDGKVPSDVFDCIIATQTLQVIYDIRAAIRTLYRILKPGGALLITTNGMAQTNRIVESTWPEQWRPTTNSMRTLLGEFFKKVEVGSYGNVKAACAFLMGLSCEDMPTDEIDALDPDYEVIVWAIAVKDKEDDAQLKLFSTSSAVPSSNVFISSGSGLADAQRITLPQTQPQPQP